MIGTRRSMAVGLVVSVSMASGIWLECGGRVDAQSVQTAGPAAIVGAWTLNKDLSDAPQDRRADGSGQQNGGTNSGGGGRRRGGGFGRGGGGGLGGGGGAAPRGDPEQMARVRDALRDVTDPPDHLTIVQTDTMIIFTGPDGRTTRLSPDGKKVKDDSTKSERKTRWDGGKLVSEINGLGPGKITETYSIDPERHQLHIDAQVESRPDIHHVYDADTNR